MLSRTGKGRERHTSTSQDGYEQSTTPPASPASHTPPRNRHSAIDSRRALGARSDMARAPGTPVGRLLASEGIPVRSPRRVRQRSWQQKARDWPANFLLSLETSLSLFSLDPAGYPLAIFLNALHFTLRLPTFYSALPSFSSLFSRASASRYARTTAALAGDAEARLEALQNKGAGGTWSWLAWWLSIGLILLSVANATYLATRRRKYVMALRKDPISSPNAKSTTLDFSPTKKKQTFGEALKARAKQLIWSAPPEEPHVYPVQELDVWTPDYFKWSLRLFTLYPPPIACMYHFLSPSRFFPFLICGGLFLAQTFLLVHLYSTLVSDRAALQAEVLHEYNAKFVHPRVFVQKRDACVSTSEAEFVRPEDYRLYAPAQGRQGHRGGEDEDEDEVVRRGSGRKVRRRESTAPREVEPGESPAPLRKKGSLLA
ncbi:hypothetical protein JCM10207_007400 [Rhodosporidiobolus poonsookiae]